LYALARDARLRVHPQALAAGKAKSAFEDSDFDNFRLDPRFAELLARDWEAEKVALASAGVATRAELAPHDFIDARGLAHGGNLVTERNAELELAIDRDIDDEAGYLVYCDWLQELATCEPDFCSLAASRRSPNESERMLAYADFGRYVMAHSRELLSGFRPSLASGAAFWRRGASNASCSIPATSGAARQFFDAALLRHAQLRVLPARCGSSDIVAKGVDYSDIVAVLRSVDCHTFASSRSASPTTSCPGRTSTSPTFRAMPHFARSRASCGITVDKLDLPRLRSLAIRTNKLSAENSRPCARRAGRRSRRLELWFGNTEWGAAEFPRTISR
jgi:uncharacterized protein (TIGR02996 family)